MRVIAQNSGAEPSTIVAGAQSRGSRFAYDVVRGCWVDVWKDALLDPVTVVTTALETAVSAAGIALTSDDLIHDPKAQVLTKP